MSRAGIFVVVLWSLMTCSLGFTMDRSALVLSTWDTAPSLNTYQRISIDPTSNSKTQTMDTDKFRQAENIKMLTKVKDGIQENQTREKRSTTENIRVGIKLIGDVVSTVKNDDSDSFERITGTVAAPRNVVLLLIDDKNLDEDKRENLWRDRTETLFTIKGSLQNCGDKSDISSESALVSESNEKDCDCERLLYSNIRELLSWAKYTRQMATGTVSSSNFTTPLFLDYVASSSDILTGFDGSSEGDAKLKLRKSKRDSSDVWRMIDLGNRAKSIPILLTPEPKTEETTNYDGAWNIFDVFSKIRMAFFRSLLESLSRKDGTFEDKFSPRIPFSLKPMVSNLIENIIRELKFISKHKGYVLIAVVPRNERVIVIDLLQREISADTLLVVTETCSGNKSISPFVARGPNDQILREAKTIWELPMVIRNAIAGGCHDPGCPNRQRRDVPTVSHMPIEIFAQESSTWKRITRDKNVERLDTTNIEETTIAEQQARSSTPPETMSNSPTTLLGVATSLLAVTALIP